MLVWLCALIPFGLMTPQGHATPAPAAPVPAAPVHDPGDTPTVRQIGAPEVLELSDDKAAQSDTIRVDDQAVEVRAPSEERMAMYENDDAYEYTREAPPEESLGILSWILSTIVDLLTSSETSRTITEIVIYTLVAIAIAYGLLAVIRMEPRSKRRSSTSGYRADGLEEQVQATDFEPLIDQAMQDEDYRSVIRLMYLHGLQKLDRSEHIEWAPDRTNRQYANDLSGTDLQGPFREATRIFDIVWYGDVDVTRSDIERLRPPFDTSEKRQTLCPKTPHRLRRPLLIPHPVRRLRRREGRANDLFPEPESV